MMLAALQRYICISEMEPKRLETIPIAESGDETTSYIIMQRDGQYVGLPQHVHNTVAGGVYEACGWTSTGASC